MSVRHTPGPWEAEHERVYAGSTSQCVAIALAPRSAERARLIAAAPTMLEALRELDAMYRRIAPDDPDGLSPDLHPAWKACKAAIAKAEGRA